MGRTARTAIGAAFSLILAVTSAAAGQNGRRQDVDDRVAARVRSAIGPAADGIDGQPRIIGGTKAPPASWPAVVALVRAGVPADYDAQFCGGTLVGPRWVLTAAHCVFDITESQLEILQGTQILSTTGSLGTRHAVAAIHVHPDWDSTSFENDVALVELAADIAGAPTLPMLGGGRPARLARAGTGVTAIGWGATDKAGTVYPTELRQVSLEVVRRAECNEKKSYDGEVARTMLCAASPKAGARDSCNGDSGGPLLVRDRDNGGQWTIAGLVSWGKACALKRFPGVYTRVAAVSPWVRTTMATVSPSPAPDPRRCRKLDGADAQACWNAVIAAAERRLDRMVAEVGASLGPDRLAALRSGQAAWRSALTGLCRAAETIEGTSAGRACIAKALDRRIADLAALPVETED
ncbi:serine protease [Prosthecomicrobium sp. N25]|uniref:serine protease n=1 Tax=Prosthecomicrobium sp. N25 TaxID=3129254 RepID=UPI003076F48A